MYKDPDCNFDLTYILKVGEDFRINKNDRIKNIYESNFEEVPLPTEEEQPQQQDDFQEEQVEVHSAIKQFLSSMVYPASRPKDSKDFPDITLELDFVNGYSCLESTHNLYYTGENTIVFPAAILTVVMNTSTRKQEFYGAYGEHISPASFDKFHKGPIVSLTYLRDKNLVATGSMGLNPEVCVWRTGDWAFVSKFHQGKNSKAVGLISFFLEGRYILTIERAAKLNKWHLWTIEGEGKKTDVLEGSIYGMATHGNKFSVASDKGVVEYQYDQATNQVTSNKLSDKFCTCIAYLGSSVVFGTYDGSFHSNQSSFNMEEGVLFCLTIKDDLIYTSGSVGKRLLVLNKQFQRLKEYQLNEVARSIDVREGKIIAGLRDGTIVQIVDDKVQEIMVCHVRGELYGLCFDHQTNHFITAGDDNRILNFDVSTRRVVKETHISSKQCYNKLYERNKLNPFPCSQQSRAVAVKGNLMVYTTNNSELYLQLLDSQKVFQFQLEDKSETLKFSEDGGTLAVGCHNDCIYLFQVGEEGLKEKGSLSGHESYINDLDFSLDGRHLRSAGVEGELRYWDLESMKEIILSSKKVSSTQLLEIKENEWAGVCRFSWQTSSIWKEITDFQFINKMALSQSEDYLALGEDDNCVRLYRSPTSKFRKFRGHGNHVMNVCWSSQDQYLASVGGPDRCLLIWKVKEAQ